MDVLVIGGGGSGGFTAAAAAMKAGARVGMVEAARLGGLCILAGCMPSKALLHSAADLKARGRLGAMVYPKVLRAKRNLVDHLAAARAAAVEAKESQGLQVFRGRARLKGPRQVEAGGRVITAENIVIATGSTELIPPLPGLKEGAFLTSGTFMDLESLPASLMILGGGAVAVEMAQYAARMGVKTILLQRSAGLLSKEPPRCGKIVAATLVDDGVEVLTGTQLIRVEQEGEANTAYFSRQGQKEERRAEALLLALGRVPNSMGLGLEEIGVELLRGAIKVDRCMRSSRQNIFAAGDVTGVNMVVNLAILQGEVAGYNAACGGEDREIDDSILPQAVFTDPQYARVGLSAVQCQQAGMDYVEAVQELEGTGIARTYPRALRGYVSLRAERAGGRLLGADMVMPEASSMIHDIAVAIKLGGSARDLAGIPYVHPSLAEVTNFCAHRLRSQLGDKG